MGATSSTQSHGGHTDRTDAEACYFCQGGRFSERPVTEGHVGVNFTDDREANRFGTILDVSVDGRDVTNECAEAMAGDPGWVILYEGMRRCERGWDHAFAVRRAGHVAVVTR